MSPSEISLTKLPTELLSKILSFLLPDDFRTLRYVILACHDTDHKILGFVADQLLEDQRTWLLGRWRKLHADTPVLSGSPAGIEKWAEQIIGKQYLDTAEDKNEAEVINESDKWVSHLTSSLVVWLRTEVSKLTRYTNRFSRKPIWNTDLSYAGISIVIQPHVWYRHGK